MLTGPKKFVIFHQFVQKLHGGRFCAKFGTYVGVADIITCDKVLGDRFTYVDSVGVFMEFSDVFARARGIKIYGVLRMEFH